MDSKKTSTLIVGLITGGAILGMAAEPAEAQYYNYSSSYCQPAPVFIAPAPVFIAPAPVFVAPAPVFVTPAPVYYRPAYRSYSGRSFGYVSRPRHSYHYSRSYCRPRRHHGRSISFGFGYRR